MAEHNISGSEAEGCVAVFLRRNGYKVIDRNWKTKWCEIDIVAKKDKLIHFVEVKYRRAGSQGQGFDYITKAKLSKMRLAADSWVQQSDWTGEYVLSAAEVSGSDFDVEFLPQI